MWKVLLRIVCLLVLVLSCGAISFSQYVDRILRPCTSNQSTTPYVEAIALPSGDLNLISCVGQNVLVNGVPISGGGGGSGTVTSVDVQLPTNMFTMSGGPVTTSGTIFGTFANQSPNRFFVGPASGSAQQPTFRTMVAADLPSTAVTPGSYTSANITVDQQGRITAAANGTGSSGITGTGAFPSLAKFTAPTVIGDSFFFDDGTTVTAGNTAAANGFQGSGSSTIIGDIFNNQNNTQISIVDNLKQIFIGTTNTATVAIGSGGGIVTVGGPLNVAGTLTLSNQTANTVFAGPASGASAAPTFRALVAADLPGGVATASGTVNQVSKFTSASGLGNANIRDDGTFVSVGNPASSSGLATGNQFTQMGDIFSVGNGTMVSIDDNANSVSMNAPLVLDSSLAIGLGTPILSHLSATATLDFGSLIAIGCEDLTITVTGASVGDTVSLGVPQSSIVPNGTFFGWVSAANTVSVRFCTFVSGNPASGVFRADVWQH